MKKWFSLLLVLCLLAGFSAQAEELMTLEREVEWPITTEDITIKVFGMKGSLHCDWAEMDLWQWLTENTGLKFTFDTPTADALAERKNLVLASGDLPDLFIASKFTADEIVKYGVEQGLLVPLDEYMDYMPHVKKALEDYPAARASFVAEDGHIYTQNLINLDIWTATSRHLFINTTWLNNVGKEIPTTIDEFHDVLLTFKAQDANGNGDPDDEVPLGSQKDLSYVRTAILSAYGLLTNGFEIERSTGDIVYSPITENYKAYLKTMHTFWEEGLLDVDMFSQDNTTFKSRAATNIYGAFDGLASFAVAPATMIDEFAMLTPLTSDMNAEPIQFYNGAVSLGVAAISASCEHIEEVCKLLDWMYTAEGYEVLANGPHNYNVEPDGSIAFIMKDGTHGGTDTAFRSTLTFAPDNSLPVNMHTVEEIMTISYSNYQANYNNATLFSQISEHALPYKWNCTPTVIWTSDEAEAISDIASLKNYVETMEAKFITGDADIDADWDSYVAAVKTYSFDELLNAYTSGYTRYLNATGN